LRDELGEQSIERHTRWAEVKRKLEDAKDSRFRNVESNLREDYYRDWLREVREKLEKKGKEREKDKIKERSCKKEKERDREKNHERGERDKEQKDNDQDRNEKHKERTKEKEKIKKDKNKERPKKEGERSKSKAKPKDKDKEKRRHKSESEEDGEARDEIGIDENQLDKNNSSDREEDSAHVSPVRQIREVQLDENEEKDRRDREREHKAQNALREREKEVQRVLAPHLRDRDKERQAHARCEAVQHFTALLTDLIRDPDVSWKEAKRTLRKDSRSEVTEILQKEEKEKMFAEHIEKLSLKKKAKFRNMLDEISDLSLTVNWKKVRSLIKDDPRYAKFSSSDRKCEKEFNEYMKDKMVQAKADFRELLMESKFISYKTLKSINDSEQVLKDIEATLSKDRRYLILDCIRQERLELLMVHLEELERKGPPPPPTATEPARRDKH